MTKPTVVFDVESYRNYLLIGFRNAETGNLRQFEAYGEDACLSADDRRIVQAIFDRYLSISFNGNNYDMPIISSALKGATCSQLKDIGDKIIVNNIKAWRLGIEPIKADHIDIFDVAPLMASLKIYGGRLHCRKMQDLPIAPNELIREDQLPLLRLYNGNDMVTTQQLYEHLAPQIALRQEMSKTYGIDLRSKSDAQIAEAVIVAEVEREIGERVVRPEVPTGTSFNYIPPRFVTFETQELQDLLLAIREVKFVVPDSGNVQLPDTLKKANVRIGNGRYRMGIGGLHSSEQTVSHYSDDEYQISDHDVASYYPAIILRTGLAPPQMGGAFTRCYQGLVDQRLAAKRRGDKVTANSLKIVVNGSFGKLGSKWSKLYSPNLMIQTTLTGQLSLLMLIERLERAGIEVISANTDGVTIRAARCDLEKRDAVIRKWEADTGFETEETLYRSIHFRDVNSYIAIMPDGKLKLKGAFAMEDLCPSPMVGLAKNPTNEVCVEAVAKFLRDGVPVEDTIRRCVDARRFVTIRQVNGGAVDQDGALLGKAIRWYYAKGVEGPLRYKINGYTVPRSDGARPIMELPEKVPDDVNYDWYIQEANSLLADVGIVPMADLASDLV